MVLGLSHPRGPLAWADGSASTTCCGAGGLCDEYREERYRPAPALRRLVRAGRLGRGGGAGFFEYDDGRRSPLSPLSRIAIENAASPRTQTGPASRLGFARRHLLAPQDNLTFSRAHAFRPREPGPPPFQRFLDAHREAVWRFLVSSVGRQRRRGLLPGDVHLGAARLSAAARQTRTCAHGC